MFWKESSGKHAPSLSSSFYQVTGQAYTPQ